MDLGFPWSDDEMMTHVRKAVRSYWTGRSGQASNQLKGKVRDAGSRSEVTGGQHLNAFRDLLCDLVRASGFRRDEIRFTTGIQLPGYYRPAKKWDIVVVRSGRLCAAVELKSQVGSFGNNVNNRSEEAVGNSVDFWMAFREKRLGLHRPWLGYFFFLQDHPESTRPVKLTDTEFPPDPIFRDSSYADRYRILCERMILERNYDGACLLLSPRGEDGDYREPVAELGFAKFARGLFGHLIGCL
jgi:hypothetical protein